eukprot:UN10396
MSLRQAKTAAMRSPSSNAGERYFNQNKENITPQVLEYRLDDPVNKRVCSMDIDLPHYRFLEDVLSDSSKKVLNSSLHRTGSADSEGVAFEVVQRISKVKLLP